MLVDKNENGFLLRMYTNCRGTCKNAKNCIKISWTNNIQKIRFIVLSWKIVTWFLLWMWEARHKNEKKNPAKSRIKISREIKKNQSIILYWAEVRGIHENIRL